MDGDTKQEKEIDGPEGHEFDVSNVLSAFWIRLSIQIDNGLEQFLLGGRYCFLLYIRILLAVICIAFKAPEIIKLVNQLLT